MKVALIYNARLPVNAYGGTERVVWWLAKGLHELGHEVFLVCQPKSRCPFAEIIPTDFKEPVEHLAPLKRMALFHHFVTPNETPTRPYMVTIGGNGKLGEKFLSNTVFISRNHASRHGADCYVHNGLDPDDYLYSEQKNGYLLFLAKASWRVKNVKGAIQLARKTRRPLHIVGGKRWPAHRWGGILWKGFLGGESKAQVISAANGLLFPILWNEPFGLAIVEALISGTPVIARSLGSMPELIHKDVGVLCHTKEDFIAGIESLSQFHPARCRSWVMENFHYLKMAKAYEQCYERVLSGETLNRNIPQATTPPQQVFPIQ